MAQTASYFLFWFSRGKTCQGLSEQPVRVLSKPLYLLSFLHLFSHRSFLLGPAATLTHDTFFTVTSEIVLKFQIDFFCEYKKLWCQILVSKYTLALACFPPQGQLIQVLYCCRTHFRIQWLAKKDLNHHHSLSQYQYFNISYCLISFSMSIQTFSNF